MYYPSPLRGEGKGEGAFQRAYCNTPLQNAHNTCPDIPAYLPAGRQVRNLVILISLTHNLSFINI